MTSTPSNTRFTGIWTALVTPFDSSGDIDFDAYSRLLDRQVKAEVTGVVPCGTTGETPTLTLEERKHLIEFTIKKLAGSSVRVMAGTGSNSTRSTVEFSKWACAAGVDSLLVVVPYYNKPTQNGLKNHFYKIAEAVDRPVVLYNVPGRSAARLEVDTIAYLASHRNIRALKEATGDVSFTSDVIWKLHAEGAELDILSGDDPIFLPLLAVGATGLISVASNVIPAEMVAIQKAFDRGDAAAARELHLKYFPLFRRLFIESNPSPVKYALHRMGLCGPDVREPLIEMTLQNKDTLAGELAELGLIGREA